MDFNIYCDESRHLINDKINRFMVIGLIRIKTNNLKSTLKDINDFRKKHNYHSEIKWKKTSLQNYKLYMSLIDYFFRNINLDFRCIVIDKNSIKNEFFNQSGDDFFYKMYYRLLLSKIKMTNSKYKIYIDEKDCNTSHRCIKLKEYLENKIHSYINNIELQIYPSSSDEIQISQLTDLFIGCVGYQFNNFYSNKAKVKLCEYLCSMLNINSFKDQGTGFDSKFDIFKINLK